MMCIPDSIFQDIPNDWLDALSGHQRKTIDLYLKKGKSPEEIAQLWLSAKPENTFGFGGNPGKNIFYQKVIDELRSFLCGGSAYDEDRKKITEQGEIPKGILIAAIASAISPSVGASAVFLAPVIVLSTLTICKMGLKAWCNLHEPKSDQ